MVKSAKWNDQQRRVLVELYIAQAGNGKGGDNGLNSVGWKAVQEQFSSKLELSYKKSQLQSQWSDLKNRYTVFKRVKENSGFGWDDAEQQPLAPESVWDAFLKSHPKAKEFRNKGFPLFQLMEDFLIRTVATGQFATTGDCASIDATNPPTVTQNMSDLDTTDGNEEIDSNDANILQDITVTFPTLSTRSVASPPHHVQRPQHKKSKVANKKDMLVEVIRRHTESTEALADRADRQYNARLAAKTSDVDRAVKILHTSQKVFFLMKEKLTIANIFMKESVHATAIIHMADEDHTEYLKLLLDHNV